MEHFNHEEAASLIKKIEQLEVSKRLEGVYLFLFLFDNRTSWLNPLILNNINYRKMLGEDLGSCSLDELQQLEHQLEKSVSKIRARKVFESVLFL